MERKNISFSKSNEAIEEVALKHPVLEKFKNTEISKEIKSLTGILKGKYPPGTSYDDMRYEYFKDRYNL